MAPLPPPPPPRADSRCPLPSLVHLQGDWANVYEPSDDTYLLLDALAADLAVLRAALPAAAATRLDPGHRRATAGAEPRDRAAGRGARRCLGALGRALLCRQSSGHGVGAVRDRARGEPRDTLTLTPTITPTITLE